MGSCSTKQRDADRGSKSVKRNIVQMRKRTMAEVQDEAIQAQKVAQGLSQQFVRKAVLAIVTVDSTCGAYIRKNNIIAKRLAEVCGGELPTMNTIIELMAEHTEIIEEPMKQKYDKLEKKYGLLQKKNEALVEDVDALKQQLKEATRNCISPHVKVSQIFNKMKSKNKQSLLAKNIKKNWAVREQIEQKAKFVKTNRLTAPEQKAFVEMLRRKKYEPRASRVIKEVKSDEEISSQEVEFDDNEGAVIIVRH